MKKFTNLVKNESLKLWGQTSWRVLIIILSVILLLTPLFGLLIDSLFNTAAIYDPGYEDYLDRADIAREAGAELEAREYEVMAEAARYFYGLELYRTSAEYSIYYSDYQELLLAQSSLELLESGKYTIEDLYKSYFSSLDPIYYFLVGYGFYDDTDELGYYQYNVLDTVKQAIEEKGVAAWIKAVETEITRIRFEIENFSMSFYYNQMSAAAEGTLRELKNERESAKSRLSEALPDDEKDYLESMISYYDDTISCYETYKRGVELLLENNCKYTSWEYKTVTELLYSAATSCQYSTPVTEEDFNADYYFYQYDSVEEFNIAMEKERLVAIEGQKYGIYSLENSIPLPKALPETSVKTKISDQLRTFVGMLTILFICFGGITMAHEYSSGTVRLLLIKPRSRVRILGSKFVCLAFWWIILSFGSLIVIGLENIIFYGIGDIFVPDLTAGRNGISAIPSFISLLGVFGEEFLIGMLYITFAILFAVLTKKAALSIIFPMLVSLGASIIQSICLALYEEGVTFIAYTPFIYLDFEFLHSTAADRFMSVDNLSDIMDMLTMSSTDILLGNHASILMGIIMLSLLVFAFVAISFASFRKQKI